MEMGCVAAQLRALQAGRGRGASEGEKVTEEVAARRVERVEVAVRQRRRDNDGRVRWEAAGRRAARHVFVVVGERGNKVGVGACRQGGVLGSVNGFCSQLATELAHALI